MSKAATVLFLSTARRNLASACSFTSRYGSLRDLSPTDHLLDILMLHTVRGSFLTNARTRRAHRYVRSSKSYVPRFAVSVIRLFFLNVFLVFYFLFLICCSLLDVRYSPSASRQ